MFRALSLTVAVAVVQLAFCELAVADPDLSLVRVAINKEKSSVSIAGGTHLDVVAAVLRALEKHQLPANDVTVGPFLQLPASDREGVGDPLLFIYVAHNAKGHEKMAFISPPPEVPFKIVMAIAAELGACGLTDVRLISNDQIRQIENLHSPTMNAEKPASEDAVE